ncbi:uncharacterized protein CDV56_105471 [Aspergillus thermomutatus]|uniref:C3H1-type domain-containing protein n=1 Tax=Aspergillus thermomutatus TaxID=41047 RepID=A0A397GDD4_ASPTH|nr:uncharacterized protein CDV56_105471 [Aspergillus thermomutatus]RHZ48961.1 hypothetical protein CDV56_105471 [Aspergillus thermomutatus]
MSSPLRPQFFCARPNGTLVPLVAVDELPIHLNIRSAPRVLSPGDTQGMTSLGTVSPRCSFYIVEGALPFSRFQFPVNLPNVPSQRAREYDNQGPAPRYMPDENGVGPQQRLAIQPMYPQGNGQNWVMPNPPPNHGWIVPANMGTAPNAGAAAGHADRNGGGNPRQGGPKKEYCSYWIRHGECDYQQQGCLFKHEMPTDRSMLEKLGLRDIPRWYRDKYNVPSLSSGGGNQIRESRALAGLLDDAASDRGAVRGSRLAISATAEHSDTERSNKDKGAVSMHQPASLALPGRPNFTNGNSPRGSAHPRGSKQAQGAQLQSPSSHVRNQGGPGYTSAPQNRGTNVHNKKIDLLSFDPLPDYRSADLSRSGQQIISDPKERTKRDEFLRGLHDMFAATTVPGKTNMMPADTDVFAGQPRTKRVQPKSRRLFQDHPVAPNGGTETNASDAKQIDSLGLRLYNHTVEALKDIDDDPLFVSPKTGVIHGSARFSESPNHHRSSSTESCLSCSEPSPRAFLNSRTRNDDDDDDGRLKPLLPPIGVFTHKNPTVLKRPAVSSSDDVFGMGGGRAK